MLKIVQVKTGKIGKILNYNCKDLKVLPGDICIVEADRGKDYGRVLSTPEIVEFFQSEKDVKKIIRKANDDDLKRIKDNTAESIKAYKTCQEKIVKSELDMKLVDVEYTFDKSKIVCYFTADGRIDFRDLVKDLAGAFRIRVELRQIGVRDESKIIDGYGKCGRSLCCSLFAKDFEPVTIRMAKDQRLPLNPSKISGVCGRLICCLAYEYENYKELSKKIPREGTKVVIEDGEGYIVDLNIIKQTVVVELNDSKNRVEVPINALKKIIKTKFRAIKEEEEKFKKINLDSDELKEDDLLH